MTGMVNKCENCAEKCPQAEMAHQAALGRMYATKEFTALLKKVESGELMEVVRCKDCKHRDEDGCCTPPIISSYGWDHLEPKDNDYCSYGERKDNG